MVLNLYVKNKEQAMNKVVKESMKKIQKRHRHVETPEEPIPPPVALRSAVQPLLDQLQGVRHDVSSNEKVIEKLLNQCSDEQLTRLDNTFNKRTGYVEDKIYESATIALDKLEEIDLWCSYLKVLRSEVVELWMKAFLAEFNNSSGNDVSYDLGKFKSLLNNTMAYRKGLRRRTEEGAEQQVQEVNSCVLM